MANRVEVAVSVIASSLLHMLTNSWLASKLASLRAILRASLLTSVAASILLHGYPCVALSSTIPIASYPLAYCRGGCRDLGYNTLKPRP